jgi:hypothetical protein
MRFRFKAFSVHLFASACALGLVLGALYAGWYHWPGWYLTGALHVAGILLLVDLALGPTITLIIANPRKPRRTLARDISIIVIVQLAALVYGASALWRGRPLYYTFSGDRLEMAQASDLDPDELARARRENPAFAPHWYSVVRWVWAPLPDDPKESTRIIQSAILSGKDVIDMPRYFKPWSAGLPKLRSQLQPVDDMKQLSPSQKRTTAARMRSRGLAPGEHNALLMWGLESRRLVAVFDLRTLAIKAILSPD